MPTMATGEASPNQRERLWQIDFLTRFRGQVTRQDLVQRFGIALSNATRDFALYRQLAPENLDYDHSDKVYRRTDHFQPLFTYDREHTLQTLTLGQGLGLEACAQPILVDAAPNLNQPNLETLAAVSRAIYAGKALSIDYVSISSGETNREILPHSLVNTGLRWHARAYCRTHAEFRDFVLTRITAVDEAPAAVNDSVESIVQDHDWQRTVSLELIPHPRASFARAIELDYGLESGQSIKRSVRAAMAGYLLRRWGVDCSPEATLNPDEYQLALRDPKWIATQVSLAIAPGFSEEAGC
ncbi:helix-turn-helix transcriptional regulator [Pseudomonas syringae]|uniref:helix-turn-helix transcriptional regulator n=1 Tax=Pseudomonas syringae TaxID=317 RepID=UPI001F328088|nr:WYL domain-containing protein [Pseudomonas syringae]MCF5222773.1 WYL domain-containing protein [Pseudomonas syringae]MCF5244712.1 WYL domain-containing protein [Pseudomonas syringae]